MLIEKMKFLKIITFLFVFFGVFTNENIAHASTENPKDYKVLSISNKKLSIANVDYYLKEGDKFIKNGDFDKAKTSYLDARKLAKQLASFYSDLNSLFIGVDARIPKEMQRKGKETLQILAETNGRLASLYIKTEKPDVAVPLLVETIRILSPNSAEGKEAYKTLMQLGFVETKFNGSIKLIMITKAKVINLITKKLPSSQVSVENIKGNDHLQVTVIASEFNGLSLVKQHQLVYSALKEELASEAIHALALKTEVPN